MSIKLNDIDFFQNPYPLYAQLRQNYPCYFYTDWQCWLFSRYDDVNALLRHSSLARVLPGVSDVNLSPGLRMFNDLMSGALLDSVLAVHNKNRFFFTHLFVQNAINYLQPLIEVYANKLLHVLSDSDVIDMRLDFIAPLATYTIAEFLGMPQSDSQQLLCWSNSMLRVYEPDCSAQQMLDSLASLQSFIAYTQDIIRKRQQQPEADFISQCLRDSIEPGLIDLQTLTVNVIQIF
jgi:cytochrome P450